VHDVKAARRALFVADGVRKHVFRQTQTAVYSTLPLTGSGPHCRLDKPDGGG
jgi:hypothetical protein